MKYFGWYPPRSDHKYNPPLPHPPGWNQEDPPPGRAIPRAHLWDASVFTAPFFCLWIYIKSFSLPNLASCAEGWFRSGEGGEDTFCFKETDGSFVWSEANQACASLRSDAILAEPKTLQMFQAMYNYMEEKVGFVVVVVS